MEKNTSTINALLKTITKKVEKLCEDKSYPPTLLSYLSLMVYGMISSYGVTYLDLIYSVIEETEIFFGRDAFAKRNTKVINTYAREYNTKNEAFVLQEITKKGEEYQIQSQICILHDLEKEPSISPIFLLDFFTHEFNHILTSKKKNFFYWNGNRACRCRLFRFVISHKKKHYASGKTLSEVVNTLQTEDIIKEILSLDYREIEDANISSLLKTIAPLSSTYTSPAYPNETALYRELHRIPAYKEFVNINILEGNINFIEEDFNKTVGTDAYAQFTTLYDQFNASLVKGRKNNWQKRDVKTTAILSKKVRSFISAYIGKKYPSMKKYS